MRQSLPALLLALAALGAAPARAADADAAAALLETVGFEAHAEALGDAFSEYSGQEAPPPGFAEAWEEAAAETMSFEDLPDLAAAALAEGLTDAELAEIAAFYATAPGKAAVAGEIAAGEAEDEERMTEGTKLAEAAAAEPARLKALQAVIAGTDMVASGTALALDMTLAVAIAINSTKPAGTGEAPEALATQAKAMEPVFRDLMAGMAPATVAFTYRTLSTPELEALATFATSPAGTKFHRIINKVTADAVATRVKTFGTLLGQRFAEKRS